MPSYRITLTVGLLHPGVAPQALLPAATAAARERATVEAWDVAVVRGEARLTVRFVGQSDGEATTTARAVRATVATLADVDGLRVARRYGARWYPVAPYR